jgi:hypothetical protein
MSDSIQPPAPMHPYVGPHGRVSCHPRVGSDAGKNDYAGTVVAVYQGGSTVEEGGAAYCAVGILRDAPSEGGFVHGESDLFYFIPDDVEEARRRLVGVSCV